MPDWKRNLFLICFIHWIGSIGWSFMSALYPLFIQEELGVPDAKDAAFWAGLSSGVFAVTMGLAGPFWGYLADRYGRKPQLIRAYSAGALVLFLSGLITNIPQLIAVRLLHGAASGSVGAAMALAGSVVPPNRIPLAVGALQFANFSAVTVGPFIGSTLASAFGFRATYFFSAGFVGFSAVSILLFVRESFQRPASGPGEGISLIGDTREVLAIRGLLPALMVVPIIQGAPVMLQPVVPGFIQSITQGKDAITGSGWAFGLLGLTSGISAIVVGRFGERLDLRRVLIVFCFGASLVLLPVFFVHDYLMFVVLFSIFGFFSGGMLTSINAMVGMLIPKENLGAAFGVLNSANAMAWGLGPLAGGFLAWGIGHRRVFLVTTVSLAITGAAVGGVFKGIRAPASSYRRADAPE